MERAFSSTGCGLVVFQKLKSRCMNGCAIWLPSDELRKWFHAQPEQWAVFRKRYLKELTRPEAERDLQKLYSLAHKRKRLTLLYASKNQQRNNAIVLKDLLDGMRKPPTGTGPGALRTMGKRDAAVRRR